jgi:ankyrin repeat protein
VVELLLSKGANVDAVEGFGVTALHLAAGRGHKDVVELLLSRNADVGADDRDGWMALDWAEHAVIRKWPSCSPAGTRTPDTITRGH